MDTAIRTISLALTGAATGLLLSGCAMLSPLSDVIIPNFSDEDLGNPMAGFAPAGATSVPVSQLTNSSTTDTMSRRPGLEFSATQSVRAADVRASLPSQGENGSTGLLQQAVSSGGVGLADSALIDAALDVSPSEMGQAGASSGLLGADSIGASGNGLGAGSFAEISAAALLGLDDLTPGEGETLSGTDSEVVALIGVKTGTGTGTGIDTGAAADTAFTELSPEDVALLLEAVSTAAEPVMNAAVQTDFGSAQANVTTSSRASVGTSTTAVATAFEFSGPAAINEQAFVPVFGGNQTLSVRPTPGTLEPGLARYRSRDAEFTLQFPAGVALTHAYGANAPTITLSLRNVGSTPLVLQPENILSQFPPFEIYRWTGFNWASLTLDVAYNLDRQGIAAPVTLEPGEVASRTELFGKVALLPLTVDLPPINQLAIRLQVAGQHQAFGSIDSGFIPIDVLDGGLAQGATNLTNGSNPAFVVFDGF
ncbi:MAG: hypothetical protein CMM70_09645 [Rhodospirillaceae bacterium]|nr:hypothetical protein [Rhodospirillaceae bacterium]